VQLGPEDPSVAQHELEDGDLRADPPQLDGLLLGDQARAAAAEVLATGWAEINCRSATEV
jgi:hypothetical protein